MRFTYAYLIIAVAAVAAACGPQTSNTSTTDTATMASADTGGLAPAPDGSPPSIVLICGPNTVRFHINSWRYKVEGRADAMWQLGAAGNVDSIMINPRASEVANWPLEGPLPIVIKKGPPSGRKQTPSKGETPTPFNYTITGVCSGNGATGADTVVIDPIIILPR